MGDINSSYRIVPSHRTLLYEEEVCACVSCTYVCTCTHSYTHKISNVLTSQESVCKDLLLQTILWSPSVHDSSLSGRRKRGVGRRQLLGKPRFVFPGRVPNRSASGRGVILSSTRTDRSGFLDPRIVVSACYIQNRSVNHLSRGYGTPTSRSGRIGRGRLIAFGQNQK